MAIVTSEILWLIALFKTFGVHHTQLAYLYCDSKDFFTKALGQKQFFHLLSKMNLINIHSSS